MPDTSPAPAWAQGQDMAFLKEGARIFRDEFKANSYGAFGIPKERDIADARAHGTLIWTLQDGAMCALAIFRRASLSSVHEDFAGRQARIAAGDLFISRIAGTAGAKQHLIEKLQAQAGTTTVWVEAHVENAETMALLRSMGFRHMMTKITASSDLKGLFLHADPAVTVARSIPAIDPADLPGVKILKPEFLSAKARANILAELDAAGASAWAQHYSSYNKRSSWTSFALSGYDASDPHFIIKPSEMSKDWKSKNPARLLATCGPTIAAANFPAAMSILRSIPGEKQRVRFMRLSAGNGELSRHSDITDPEAGTADRKIARLHIPITTDKRCIFRSWTLDGAEAQLHFPERALCYIDTRKPHAVINPSDIERVHLVIDAYSSPELRKMIDG